MIFPGHSTIHTLFSLTADEFLYQNQWGEIALLTVGNLSEKILMTNTTYVSSTFTFSLLFRFLRRKKKPFQSLNFLCGKMTKSFHFQKKKKGHLFAASFVIVDSRPSLSWVERDKKRREKPLGFLMGWDFESRFYIIKFIIKLFLVIRPELLVKTDLFFNCLEVTDAFATETLKNVAAYEVE